MENVAVAFEKVSKVFASCTTTAQYVAASRYCSLFWNMYKSKINKSIRLTQGMMIATHRIKDETLRRLSKKQ